ncbi:hypothetical protein THF5H11_180013 [Vibrio jasicida]|uniref:glycine-rich domain-containing protein n=1 Tax=Vibrio jasicida TaxID=766224 RepID=UPI002893AD9F|nr:hypothetical protein THF5H11_180013 [Vibrio jasicida]CAH1607149.1 hypothetical protein THF5G08_310026 [Vibrio jasicida]
MNVIQLRLPNQLNTSNNKSFAKSVIELDLGPIKYKLKHPDTGDGWSQKELDTVETRYKVFLLLLGLYPEKTIVPTRDIDLFWHAHILDTHKYRDDCQHLFGKFIDHFPYFGLRGEEDRKRLNDTFDETLELFRGFLPEFGHNEYPKACGAGCGSSLCEPQHCNSSSCQPYLLRLMEQRPTLGHEFVKLELVD